MSGGISSLSRGGFNEISRGAAEWLVKPAPTAPEPTEINFWLKAKTR